MDISGATAGGPLPPREQVTIADVARRADVAKTTVSYVLNDSGFVSEERRARILSAIHELGYRPNPHARALRQQGVSAVGFLCADLSIGTSARVANGVRAAAGEGEVTVILVAPPAPRIDVHVITGGLTRVDGLVCCEQCAIAADTISALASFVPCVHVRGDAQHAPEARGAEAVTQLLTELSYPALGVRRPRRHNAALVQRPPR